MNTKTIKDIKKVASKRRSQSIKEAQEMQNKLYDELISNYGHKAYVEGFLGERLIKERIWFALKNIPKGATVLDVGCGDGTVTRELLQKASTVIGLDINESAIRLANEHNQDNRITYIKASIEELPTNISPVNVVTMFEVIEHLHNPEIVLKSVFNLLKPGGILCLSTPNRSCLDWRLAYIKRKILRQDLNPLYEPFAWHIYEYPLKELKDLLVKNGFIIKEIHGVIFSNKLAIAFSNHSFILEIIIRAGKIFPKLAKDVYIAAVRP